MDIPRLRIVKRDREYRNCTEKNRDKIIYHYLFNGMSCRWLDENVAEISSNYSRGYLSMGVLHYVGIINEHKGIFKGLTIIEAINILTNQNKEEFKVIILSLMRYEQNLYDDDNSRDLNSELEDDEIDYSEGKEAYRLHKIRERNQEVIKKAKNRFIEKNNGKVFCEVCKFDFSKLYGDRGKDYIEGHHKKLVSEMKEGERTKIDDIVMLCSNCHRMIHRKPLITVEELARIVDNNKIL